MENKTPEQWLEEMRDMPCYCPCPPFYDVCNNMSIPYLKKLNCNKCVREHNLKDCIE